MSTQNRTNQRNNYKRASGYKRGSRDKRNYNNKFNKYSNIPKLEKCPFVVGSTEYYTWKRERYPTRTLYGCNNKVLMVFTSKFNKD
jgi:hypothetical protein